MVIFIWLLALFWFHVDGDQGVVAEALLEALFNERGMVVGLGERHVAVHAHVYLNGQPVADASRAQIVGLAHMSD